MSRNDKECPQTPSEASLYKGILGDLKKKRKEVEAKLKTDEKLKLELEFMSVLYDEFGTGLHFWEESVMRNMLREVVVVSKTLVLVTRYDGCQAYGNCPKKSELAKFEVEV